MTADGYTIGMSYEIGTRFIFSKEPAETRQSMEWSIGQSVDFVTVADEPKIFVPKFVRSFA